MKKPRHKKILELIEKHDIGTQEELSERLKEEGLNVTQATISRDIRELKLSKVAAGSGGQKYVVMKQQHEVLMVSKYSRVLREAFLSMDAAQNILVIKTVSGMAMAVAAAIDSMKLNEVVGCIAGDDTVMVVVRTAEDTDRLIGRIRSMLLD